MSSRRKAPCIVEGCDRDYRTRKMCPFHYLRWLNGIPLDAPPLRIDNPPETCTVDGCDRPYCAKGYCRAHWERANKYGDPGDAEIRHHGTTECSVDGCDAPHLARGFCGRHYAQLPDRRAYGVVKAGRRRARARSGAIEMPIDQRKVQARIDYYGGRCWICGGADADEMDHVKPLVAGGLHVPANLRPAHGSCNRSKGATWEGVVS